MEWCVERRHKLAWRGRKRGLVVAVHSCDETEKKRSRRYSKICERRECFSLTAHIIIQYGCGSGNAKQGKSPFKHHPSKFNIIIFT